ncbi:MAG: ABC transporter substrate-binding protein [Trueperaceae bacterium]|nr:ABC transporter substrate-binding protein [Trueperaceae bacterium]
MTNSFTPRSRFPGWRRLALLLLVAAFGGMAFAQEYHEAPMLADLVAKGQLPPVADRLPTNPLVVKTVDEIGTYGGVLRRAFTGPADMNNYVRVVYDSLVRFSSDGSEIVPHLVESWEASDDFHSWTLNLRKGAKWSDGAPFNASAMTFWYVRVILNKDLTPSVPSWFANRDGTPAKLEALDDDTVRITFDFPNTLFLTELTFRDGGDRTLAAFLPGHYLEQFHPDFVPAAELDEKVKAAGLSNWVDLFMTRAMPTENPQRPTMAAWVPFNSTVSDQVFTLRRNPYYIGVDSAGNQLPYIDEVQFRFFADVEALNFAAVAGELDFQARHIQMTNYPVLMENADRANYHVITWPSFGGSDAAVWFNQEYEIDPELGSILANHDFRVALSHAVDRDEIREAAFLGLGEIRQNVPAPWHPYYPGDEYAQKYTEYDPALANELLDGIGLKKDANGNRLLPSGKPLRLELSVVPAFGPWPDVAQLVAADWAAVGVPTDVQVRERNAHFTMRDANELQVEIWNEDTTAFPFTGNPKIDPRSDPATIFAVESRRWYATDGAQGKEPAPGIARIVDIIEEAKTVGVEQQIELAKELFRHAVDELYGFGTVGLTPMVQGVVVVNDRLMNVPPVVANDWPLRTPGDARPEQFFYKAQ